jgi:hypothetical protein
MRGGLLQGLARVGMVLVLAVLFIGASMTHVASAAQSASAGPVLLEHTTDKCSRPVVWVYALHPSNNRPYEKWTAVHKGEYATISVFGRGKSPRFFWYCGWDDRYGSEEWTTCPRETTFVEMYREPTGRTIHWYCYEDFGESSIE